MSRPMQKAGSANEKCLVRFVWYPHRTESRIIGAPEEAEALPGAKVEMSLFYPVDPKQLPRELAGVAWPPQT